MTNNSNSFFFFFTLIVNPAMSKIDQLLSIFSLDRKNNQGVVAILRLQGVIGNVGVKKGLNLDTLNQSIEKAFKTPKLRAVCLAINSPGGSPVQSELIAARIINLSKEHNVPVYSFVEDVAASGGYWLACAGDKIYASKSSIIGSIGVISSSFGFSDAIKKLGIERRVYTQGNNKSILDPFVAEKKEDIKIISNLQKSIHQHFIDYIKSRRNRCLTQTDEILFNGEFWTGETATAFGLIDGIDDMYSFIKRKFGDKVKIDHIKEKQSWIKQKLGIDAGLNNIAEVAINEIKEQIIKQRFDLY